MIGYSVEIRKSDNKTLRNPLNSDKGIFSKIHFDANQIILKFKDNKIINLAQLNELEPVISNDYLQIGKDIYLDLTGDVTSFIQHSCNANTSIKIIGKKVFLVSTRVIRPNEELTFDFSITSNETRDTWQVNCQCKSWNCRKVISGFNTLSDMEKEQFLKQGIVPKYIRN